MSKSKLINRFDSVGAFVRFLDSEPVAPCWTFQMSLRKGGADWSGTDSFDASMDLLKYGDHESAKQLQAAAVRLRAADGSRRSFVPSVAGFSPNVPAYLRGLPLSMIAKGEKPANCKVVDLVYNMAAACVVDKDEIINAGAKMLTAIQAAEKSGYRVNLYAAAVANDKSSGNGRETSGAFIKIKDSGTYLTLSKIAFFLVNPSFLRRIIFAYRERFTFRAHSFYGGGYGYSVNDREKVTAAAVGAGISPSAVVMSVRDAKKMTVQQIADKLTGAGR